MILMKKLAMLICILAFATISLIAADQEAENQYRQQTIKVGLKDLFERADLMDELKNHPQLYEAFIVNKASIELSYVDRIEKTGQPTLQLHNANGTSVLAHRGGATLAREYVGQLGEFIFSPMKKQHMWYIYVFNLKSPEELVSITIPFYCEVRRPLGTEPRIAEFGVHKERVLFLHKKVETSQSLRLAPVGTRSASQQ